MLFVTILVCGTWGAYPIILAWMSAGVQGNLAVGIAFVNAFSNFGGLIGPYVMSKMRTIVGGYGAGGYILLQVYLLSAAALAFLYPWLIRTRPHTTVSR
mmetsp:Transcript_31900/g.53802  ORF Transcript_31900/g.53802 Transcript_31900/m.53802 type:complete len:99 (+) Transcript_31900:1405-1701(+)